MTRTKVFISYSHDDDRWRKQLATHLGVLEQENLIDVWDDQHTGPGADWLNAIHAQMLEARIAVLLVSSSFLTSEFIRNTEVPLLFQRHEQDGMTIYPLLVRPCPWEEVPWLARLQMRPRGAKPVSRSRGAALEEVLANVAREIASIARNTTSHVDNTVTSSGHPRLQSLETFSQSTVTASGRRAELLQIASTLKPEDLDGWIAPFASYCDRIPRSAERKALVQQLREANSQLVLQLLPRLTRLKAEDALHALVSTEGWDGVHLHELANEWLRRGMTAGRARRLLMGLVSNESTITELAFICYALLHSGLMDAASFFKQCERWQQVPPLKVETVRIPPAESEDSVTFLMGSTPQAGGLPNEFPQRPVTLTAFRLMTTPITEEQYHLFDATRRVEHSNYPIAYVNWWEAWLFCRWMNGQLPTEAQWECACRAGTSSLWWTGDSEEALKEGAWYGANTSDGSKYSRQPVKTKPPNPWGLYDMMGNVLEWCLDWFGPYPPHAQTNPDGPSLGTERVLRGGCYRGVAGHLRSAYRGDKRDPRLGLDDFGLRVAFEVKKDPPKRSAK